MDKDFLDLLTNCLPFDISKDKLFEFFDYYKNNKLGNSCPYDFLKKCYMFNWVAYRRRYMDEKDTSDPIEHFLNIGIYEQFKLQSYNKLRKKEYIGEPSVSIIVPYFNNDIYLEKCLYSLINQTLNDIEIIIVDDGSNDNGMEIARAFQARDDRIKIYGYKENKSLHMARMLGVEKATGEYIMFLDPDDFYELDACEKAYNAISLGYDIVHFKVNIINHGVLSPKEEHQAGIWFNAIKSGEYAGIEILNLALAEATLNISLCSKIISAAIYKKAFSELEKKYLRNWEDLYEFLPIAHYSRNLLVIDDILYNYNRGSGGSSFDGSDEKIQRFMKMVEIVEPIVNYCKKNNLEKYISCLKSKVFGTSISLLFTNVDKKWFSNWLDNLVDQFGALYVVSEIMKKWFNDWKIVADKFNNYKILSLSNIKSIGIYYFRISPGGVQTSIRNLCKVLLNMHYNVSLFIEEKSQYDYKFPENIKIYYINPAADEITSAQNHLAAMDRAINESKIDLMFYMAAHSRQLLWDTILLKLHKIPVISFFATNFIYDLTNIDTDYKHDNLLASLRCVDILMCLSVRNELYLRTQGINAVYVPTPAKLCSDKEIILKKDSNNIIVMARLDDRWKQVKECLLILKEIKREISDVKIIFVGDFYNRKNESSFYDQIHRWGLQNNIIITGWAEDTYKYVDQGKVLLSTSFLEGFPNCVSEAQSRGLPVVMYYLDIMQAENNKSIIQIPQSDVKLAAKEIINLLKNDEHRLDLAKMALDNCKKYSFENFQKSIEQIITELGRYSEISNYHYEDYKIAINDIIFYSKKNLPSFN